MATLDEKTLLAAEQILKRPLTDAEKLEIYRLSDIMGMKDVQSYLFLLLVFKLHEDTMKNNFAEISMLEEKIHNKLASSVERILGEGAERIGADMGEKIAEGARKNLTAFGDYHTIRGQTVLFCFMCIVSSLSYWLGANNFLSAVSTGGIFDTLMFLPAGWSVFFCGVIYTFLWIGDHWGRIKKTILYKTFLGLQIFSLLVLALNLL